jgi:hypothetical protein
MIPRITLSGLLGVGTRIAVWNSQRQALLHPKPSPPAKACYLGTNLG